MNYPVTILRRDINVATPKLRDRTRRHIVMKFKKAYRKTGLIFNNLDFSNINFQDNSQGSTVALRFYVNPHNSLKSAEMSDSEEVLDTKILLWNQFADAIINIF